MQNNTTATIEHARETLRDARHTRSEYLVGLAQGLIAPLDVIHAAVPASGVPLRKIRLDSLLQAQPRVGRGRAEAFLSEVAARLGTDEGLGKRTIAWLLDPRAGGRRYLVWLDVTQEKVVPWPGFPAAPRPDKGVQEA